MPMYPIGSNTLPGTISTSTVTLTTNDSMFQTVTVASTITLPPPTYQLSFIFCTRNIPITINYGTAVIFCGGSATTSVGIAATKPITRVSSDGTNWFIY